MEGGLFWKADHFALGSKIALAVAAYSLKQVYVIYDRNVISDLGQKMVFE